MVLPGTGSVVVVLAAKGEQAIAVLNWQTVEDMVHVLQQINNKYLTKSHYFL